MNKTRVISFSIIALALSIITVVFLSTSNVYYGATEGYRIYLNGNSIGFVESKQDLENYIDEEQQEIKDRYNVDHVYTPEGLEIVKEVTYNEEMDTTSEIYEKIKEEQDFTIEGYTVTIRGQETEENNEEEIIEEEDTIDTVYILDKDILTDAIDATVLSFVDEEQYNDYLNETQQEIEDEGTLIENVYVKETITIKKDLIPANEKIFLTSRELAQYFLFGTTASQEIYTVKAGDTIESISEANKLNVQEFLIANQDIASEDALLYTGEQVVISLIDPAITIVEETHDVSYEEIKFKTQTEVDSSLYVGYSEVVRQGENGKSLVTKKIKKENGQITQALIASTEVITPAVDRIIKTGNRTEYVVGSTEFWAWPTRTPYIISDYMGMRWGSMHNGIDITGTGYGSPIYAANDGTVITATTHWSFGNYIVIDHNNGYTTLYAHMSKLYVSVGEGVQMGEVIGAMGSTGYSTGTHLHYEVRRNGTHINPFDLYN